MVQNSFSTIYFPPGTVRFISLSICNEIHELTYSFLNWVWSSMNMKWIKMKCIDLTSEAGCSVVRGAVSDAAATMGLCCHTELWQALMCNVQFPYSWTPTLCCTVSMTTNVKPITLQWWHSSAESEDRHNLVQLQRKTTVLQVSTVTTCRESEVEMCSMIMVQLQHTILSQWKGSRLSLFEGSTKPMLDPEGPAKSCPML